MLQDDHTETFTLIASVKAFSKHGHIRSCRGYNRDISVGAHHSTHCIAPGKIHFDIKMKEEFFSPSLSSKNRAGKKADIRSVLPKAGQETAPFPAPERLTNGWLLLPFPLPHRSAFLISHWDCNSPNTPRRVVLVVLPTCTEAGSVRNSMTGDSAPTWEIHLK